MYTDLLLGLAVVFLGSIGVVVATSGDESPPAVAAEDGDSEPAEAGGNPTTSTTSTSTSTSTTTTSTTVPIETCQVLYEPAEDPDEAFLVRIYGRPDADDFAAQFRREISDRLARENRLRTDGGDPFSFNKINVGLVIINHGPSADPGSSTDTEIAEQIYADLKASFPQQFANARVRPGKIYSGDTRTSIEIFVIYERPCTIEA